MEMRKLSQGSSWQAIRLMLDEVHEKQNRGKGQQDVFFCCCFG
jgi:hypothetical protein